MSALSNEGPRTSPNNYVSGFKPACETLCCISLHYYTSDMAVVHNYAFTFTEIENKNSDIPKLFNEKITIMS